MNLLLMYEKFIDRTSGLGSLLSTNEINRYLNRWYQFMIPADIGGDMSEGLWSQDTEIGVSVYPYPGYVIAPRADAAWLESVSTGRTFLDTETDRAVFEYSDSYPNTSNGRPHTALFSERKMTLYPTPDAVYTVSVPCRSGPSAILSTSGIANEIHAMAVVSGAAHEFLTDKEDLEGANREGAAYELYKARLQVYAHGKPRHRRPARSF